jgi:hypothetical protein
MNNDVLFQTKDGPVEPLHFGIYNWIEFRYVKDYQVALDKNHRWRWRFGEDDLWSEKSYGNINIAQGAAYAAYVGIENYEP